jgi:hypothetical protein
MNAVTFKTIAERTPLVQAAEQLLQRTIEERTGIFPARGEEPSVGIILDIKNGIGEEGFRIESDSDGPVRITGNDERGLLYGIGKFLRISCFENCSFSPGSWRGTCVPQKKVRGMYFATHFHNWYHDAPVEEITRYVEELALWGCNALLVWFDMHHYRGIDDSAARKMLKRLHIILEAAEHVGIRAGLNTISNEGYSSSPVELRADWTDGHDGYFRPPGGHYHVEICPNVPSGLDLILKWRDEMLEAFCSIEIEYFWIWPYDQGGCTCAKCAPWGSNGFLRVAEPVAQLVRSRFPRAKIVLSTWYFDLFVKGEWDGLRTAFGRHKPDWIDYLMIDDFGGFSQNLLEHSIPGGFPVVSFPEISMEGMSPWGGFGANPRPLHWQAYHLKTRDLVSGGFPYSEGIFEDLNKVLLLQWGWDPNRDAEDIIREYAASCFSADVADDVLSAVLMMEEDHGIDAKKDEDGLIYRTSPLPKAEVCWDLMSRTDTKLPDSIRHTWRWRILWLRAALDAELKRTHSKPSDFTEMYMRELIGIYHANNAEGCVRPPVTNAIASC